MSKDNNPPQPIKRGLGGGTKTGSTPQNSSQGAGSQGSGGNSPSKK